MEQLGTLTCSKMVSYLMFNEGKKKDNFLSLGQPNAGGYVVIDAEGWSDVGFDSWGNTDAICKIFP